MNEHNYDEKIKTFQLLTDTDDQNIAMEYLSQYNWDENLAASNYMKDLTNNHSRNINSINNIPHYSERENLEAHEKLLSSSQQTNQGRPQTQSSSTFGSIMKYIKSFIFCTKQTEEEIQPVSFLRNIPNRIDNLNNFTSLLRNKIGLLVFYSNNNIAYLEQFFQAISQTEYIVDILRENYVIFALDINTNEGQRISSLLLDHSLTPSFLFLSNSTQRNINRSSVISRLEGEINEHVFQEYLIHNIEEAEKKKNSNNEFQEDSHAQMIKIQKEELKKLEEMEFQKKQKEIEAEKERNRILEEQIRKEKELEELRKTKLNSLPSEPEENEPNAAKIVFRFPDGNTRKERRFMKDSKIQVLYDYVDSLGKDIFTESESYDLIQTFPFKSYGNKEKTLAEEGLFPNALLQIREI